MSKTAYTHAVPLYVATGSTTAQDWASPAPGEVAADSPLTLGQEVIFPESGTDRPLFAVGAVGATVATAGDWLGNGTKYLLNTQVLGGPLAGLPDADIERVNLIADSGELVMVYARAGEALSRGEIVMLDHTAGGVFEVIKATDAGKAIGVCLINMADGDRALFVKKGLVKVKSAAAVTAGASLLVSAGKVDDVVTPGTDISIGRAIDAAAGADELILAHVCLPK